MGYSTCTSLLYMDIRSRPCVRVSLPDQRGSPVTAHLGRHTIVTVTGSSRVSIPAKLAACVRRTNNTLRGGGGRVPCLNTHSAKTLTSGAPWSVVWRAYISRCDRGWEARRGQVLGCASFALVGCREERGANTTKARDILVVQVVVAIIFKKRRR